MVGPKNESWLERRDHIAHMTANSLLYTYAYHQKTDRASHTQSKPLSFIQFMTTFEHVSDESNIISDAISRLELISMPLDINSKVLANEQAKDSELRNLCSASSTSMELVPVALDNHSIYYDISTAVTRRELGVVLQSTVGHHYWLRLAVQVIFIQRIGQTTCMQTNLHDIIPCRLEFYNRTLAPHFEVSNLVPKGQ